MFIAVLEIYTVLEMYITTLTDAHIVDGAKLLSTPSSPGNLDVELDVMTTRAINTSFLLIFLKTFTFSNFVSFRFLLQKKLLHKW